MEMLSQTELRSLLPQIHRELQEKKVNKLKATGLVFIDFQNIALSIDKFHKFFGVNIRQVEVNKPECDLASEILDLMCVEVVDGILMQCEREYGFSENPQGQLRAIDISSLSKEEQEGLLLMVFFYCLLFISVNPLPAADIYYTYSDTLKL